MTRDPVFVDVTRHQPALEQLRAQLLAGATDELSGKMIVEQAHTILQRLLLEADQGPDRPGAVAEPAGGGAWHAFRAKDAPDEETVICWSEDASAHVVLFGSWQHQQLAFLYVLGGDSGWTARYPPEGEVLISMQEARLFGAGGRQISAAWDERVRALRNQLRRPPEGDLDWSCPACGWPNEAEAMACHECGAPRRAMPAAPGTEGLEGPGPAMKPTGDLEAMRRSGVSTSATSAIRSAAGALLRRRTEEEVKRCVSCQRPINATARFCEHCGMRQPLQCPSCGHTAAAESKFCDQCGTKLIRDGE